MPKNKELAREIFLRNLFIIVFVTLVTWIVLFVVVVVVYIVIYFLSNLDFSQILWRKFYSTGFPKIYQPLTEFGI